MLKIGEFARITQVSIKTLRHYDALGLLRPAHIDPESGYRFYTMDQIVDVVRLLALKDCGFGLEEIGYLFRQHDAAAIEKLLRERIAAQADLVATEQARLQRMAARLQQFITTNTAEVFDVALKRTEPITLVGKRGSLATTDEIGPFAVAVVAQLAVAAIAFARPLIHLYFNDDNGNDELETGDHIDLFVGAPVAAIPPVLGEFDCQRLPGGDLVACIVYRGDYVGIGKAFQALDRWIATSGYRQSGPCREIYHRSPAHTDDPAEYLTEIQSPIVAASISTMLEEAKL
ncbi:MAG TPA: MerR family transcriptional regulator [Ktedonobacterales bacterium]|nr:MerR family transcriptional regulator [Ktedonobacterales bacterium]